MPTRAPAHVIRNARLLTVAAAQHAIDDPALLALQISRRLPFWVAARAGRLLARTGSALGAAGVEALGHVLEGHEEMAEAVLVSRAPLQGPMDAEVAVLLDRPDLLGPSARGITRARAAWASGDVTGALRASAAPGRATRAYGRRLSSEFRLLTEPFPLRRGRRAEAAGESEQPAGLEGRRVVHLLTNSLPHTQSGYSLRSHRILTALREHGVESIAVTRTGYPVMVGIAAARDEDEVDGIVYRRVLPSRLGSTTADRLDQQVDAVVAAAHAHRADVLHATSPFPNGLVAQEAARRLGIGWVYEVRGLPEQTWMAGRRTDAARQRAGASERRRLLARREAELAAAADAVVTLSDTMRDELVARGVPAEQITIVPNGVEAGMLTNRISSADARARLGLPREAFLVGAVSALVEYEGFETTMRAVARIIHGPDTPERLRERLGIVLAGSGTARPALLALSRELGIEDRVTMPGRVARSDAAVWVQALDAVTLPRLDLEVTRAVTPQKPLEAMALDRPVIASDLAAIRETTAGAAMLVTPGDPAALADAIMRIAEDTELRESLIRQGRELAMGRSWTCLAARYGDVYARAARTHGRGETVGRTVC